MLTPEQIEDNLTAHPDSKWRACPVCGKAHATPGWSAYVGYWHIAGCCSEDCKDSAVEEYVTLRSGLLKPEPVVDEAKVRETFIRLVYEAAMQIDCENIQRMMEAVDWRWHDEVPSVDQVRDNLMEFCAKLIRETKEVRSMAGPWSGGWYFIVDRGTDEDGPWVRVYLGWGEISGNFEGETITGGVHK